MENKNMKTILTSICIFCTLMSFSQNENNVYFESIRIKNISIDSFENKSLASDFKNGFLTINSKTQNDISIYWGMEPDSTCCSDLKYRLKGFDDYWLVIGEETYTRYTNLKRGEYEFLLMYTENKSQDINRISFKLEVK